VNVLAKFGHREVLVIRQCLWSLSIGSGNLCTYAFSWTLHFLDLISSCMNNFFVAYSFNQIVMQMDVSTYTSVWMHVYEWN